MNLEYSINQNYENLTANDREVLNGILRDKGRTAAMSSTELAAFCHISRTTLVRLFKKLGIATYAEFKLLLGEGTGSQELARLDRKEILVNYHRMVDDLKEYDYDEICKAIKEAGTVYLFGTGNEQKAIGEEFKRIFLMFGKCCIDLFDYGEVEYASRYFQDKDLFIAISLSGESEEGIRVLRLIQHRDIQTLSITRWTNNTMARMCRYNLYAGTKMIGGGGGREASAGTRSGTQPDAQRGEPAGYEMVAAFYILLDILSVNYLEYMRGSHETGRTVQ